MRTVTKEDFSLQYDPENKFNFIESEDGEIFAYGHVDPQDIVSEVKAYASLTSSDYYTDEEYDDLLNWVDHTWAIIVTSDDEEEWRFQYGQKFEGESGAFPLTMIVR